MSQGCNVLVGESRDAVSTSYFLAELMRLRGVVERFPRLLVPRLMILLAVLLLGNAVRMRGRIVQLDRALVILVV